MRLTDVHSAGEIKNWVPNRYFPPHQLKRLDRFAQFAGGFSGISVARRWAPIFIRQPSDSGVPKSWNALGGMANAEIQHDLSYPVLRI